jgi:hypothetical protein
MRSIVQASSAYELSADIAPTPYGHHLRIISRVPKARRPQDQVQFQGLFSRQDLLALRDCIEGALGSHKTE